MIRAFAASIIASIIYAPISVIFYVYARDNIFTHPGGWIVCCPSLTAFIHLNLILIAGPILGLILEQIHDKLPGPDPLKGIILAPVLWLLLVTTAGINNLLQYPAYAVLTIQHIFVFGTLLGVFWHLLTGKEEAEEKQAANHATDNTHPAPKASPFSPPQP